MEIRHAPFIQSNILPPKPAQRKPLQPNKRASNRLPLLPSAPIAKESPKKALPLGLLGTKTDYILAAELNDSYVMAQSVGVLCVLIGYALVLFRAFPPFKNGSFNSSEKGGEKSSLFV